MDILWIFYGYSMDIIWLLYGYSMDILWLFYGYYMDIIWIFYGYSMIILWILYGYSMDILWIFYGYYMIIVWIFYGYSMIILWIFYDYSMDIIHNPCIIYTAPTICRPTATPAACKIPCAVASAVRRRLISSCTGVAMGSQRPCGRKGRCYGCNNGLVLLGNFTGNIWLICGYYMVHDG